MPNFEGVLCIKGTICYHIKFATLLLLRQILARGKPSQNCKVSTFSLSVLIYIIQLNSDMQSWCIVSEESLIIPSRERTRSLCMCLLQVAMIRTTLKIRLIVLLLLLGRRVTDPWMIAVVVLCWSLSASHRCSLAFAAPSLFLQLSCLSVITQGKDICEENMGKWHCGRAAEQIVLSFTWVSMNT